ncbi:hypothetical protein J437_LFUL007888 [Ladona fulva]|uniref:PiggyBac transposable element-derived protein domain-containing protein n=1 Tax=Ladona fulva TaxID=123851 RepID=A0A8K0P250_LADFU|nr:hypothetical protein J437_LFUL007888 [Ladona fulva]
MLSTFHKPGFVKTGKTDRITGVEVLKPNIVVDYNKSMGAVERSDMMISSIECTKKSRKWYRNVCLLNAYTLYKVNLKKNIALSNERTSKEILEGEKEGWRREEIIPRNAFRLTERYFIDAIPDGKGNGALCAKRWIEDENRGIVVLIVMWISSGSNHLEKYGIQKGGYLEVISQMSTSMLYPVSTPGIFVCKVYKQQICLSVKSTAVSPLPKMAFDVHLHPLPHEICQRLPFCSHDFDFGGLELCRMGATSSRISSALLLGSINNDEIESFRQNLGRITLEVGDNDHIYAPLLRTKPICSIEESITMCKFTVSVLFCITIMHCRNEEIPFQV